MSMGRRAPPVVLVASLAANLAAAGCAGPYAAPGLATPDRYAHAPASAAPDVAPADWWRPLDDPGLNDAVARALAGNRDLASAQLRTRLAQVAARLAGLDQWPTVSGALSAGRTGRIATDTADLAVSFDPDPWRRLAATTAAARDAALAAGQDAAAARVSLIGTACALYWDIAFTHQQITVDRATLEDQQSILRLVRAQRTFGLVSSVEVAEAQAAIALQATALSALEQHLVEDRAAFSILIGEVAPPDPPDPQEPLSLSAALPPEIPAGLPASLVGRRPDLRAAELRVRASWNTREAVRTAIYPDMVLTGAGGASSAALGQLFAHPVGSVLASVSLPFLDFPRRRLDNQTAQANQALAELAFRTAVFQALGEVDNALSNRTQLRAQRVSLQAGLTAAALADRLYGVRYRSGSVALRVWLEAQQNHRAAQLALDANQLALLDNLATLAAALGGGAVAPP